MYTVEAEAVARGNKALAELIERSRRKEANRRERCPGVRRQRAWRPRRGSRGPERPTARFANAAWDWGDGDWETALGAAAHMGRRDIAELLLGHGARLDVFAAAMLGDVDVVRAILAAHPKVRESKGPHGIPLRAHAEAGGEQARAVLELLDAER